MNGRHVRPVVLSLALWIALPGCASVDPRPFQEFHASASAFQSGTDEALQTTYELARTGFRTPSPFGDDITFDAVVLTWEEEGDATRPEQEAKPLYSQLRDLRRGAFDLNAALSEYCQYLALLAGGSAKDARDLEALARTANANLRSARDSLGFDVGDDEIALIATIGAEALRRKIERSRRKYLKETMDEAADDLARFSSLMVATMNLVAVDVNKTYLDWVDTRRRTYAVESRTDRRRKILVDVLDRNDRTFLLLESIRTLRDGYENIPIAHTEVRTSLDEPEPLLAAVRRLHGNAMRLKKLQEELAEAG